MAIDHRCAQPLHQFDHIVGELMAELEKHGIAGNTLVILTSDNGPEVVVELKTLLDQAKTTGRSRP